ncbi:hypothetical protein [Pseudohongiella nitratireducens]|uniref:hypothetical protein n=1 Tax=Pseudohongiella nitratireducens TaxID=1768907 RepID=UPI0030EEDBC5|tara:strand:+ start:681 stop:1064 length:384 start_codon:yes stop_codon:yes gene_type:complete
MKKHKATASVTLYPATMVGLSSSQYQARAHNLELVADEKEVKVCRVARPVQFKRGEEFFADELPKTMATLVEPNESGDSGEESDKPVSKMNKAELQEFLTEKEVDFPSDADKKALLELAQKATEEAE